MKRNTRSAAALAIALCLGSGRPVAAEPATLHPDPIKVVVVTGDHPFNEKTFLEAFDGQPDIDIVHAPQHDHDEIFEDVSGWNYDVMVLYHFSQVTPSPARQQAFTELLDRGVGLVVLHHGTLTYPQWPETERIYGRKRDVGGPFGFHLDQRYTVHLADPSHPILQGMSDFTAEDETYTRYYGPLRPDNHILLTTEHQPSDAVLAWTRSYAHSRVFAYQHGHDSPAFGNPAFRQILTQGIRWTAGRLPEKSGGNSLSSGSVFRQRNLEWALGALPAYESGNSRSALAVIESKVSTSLGDAAAGEALAARLAPLLSSPATRDAKSLLLRQLGQLRATAQIPAIAALLKDADLSHMARYALEAIGTADADSALRTALPATTGTQRIGIINSLGQRRDPQAIPALAALANAGDDEAAASAAMNALGNIGSQAALDALHEIKPPAALEITRKWALLGGAQLLINSGNVGNAAAVISPLLDEDSPALLRATALRLLITATPADALPRALAALKGGEPETRRAALAGLRDLPGTPATLAYSECMPALDTGTKVQLLTVLAMRGDAAALPAVLAAVTSDDESVRLAAIKALIPLGCEECVPVLAKFLTGGSETEKSAVLATLERMPGTAVSRAILNHAVTAEAPVAASLIAIVGQRGATPLLDDLKPLVHHQDPAVQAAAITALGLLVMPDSLPGIIGLLGDPPSPRGRAALEKSLAGALLRMRDKPSALQVLTSASAREPAAMRPALLRLIAALGTSPAFDFLSKMAAEGDANDRREAVRALATWRDATPFDLLWGIATNSPDAPTRELAMEGCVAMLALPDARFKEDRMLLCVRALGLTGDVDLRVELLALLEESQDIAVLRAVLPLMGDPDLDAAATATTLEVASKLIMDFPDETAAAIGKIAAEASDGGMRRRAESVLARMREIRASIRAEWNFNEDTGGWAAANQCETALKDGSLLIHSTGVDPFIQVTRDIPPGSYLLTLRMKSDSAGPAQFYWTTDKARTFNSDRVLTITPVQNDGAWHEHQLILTLDDTLRELRFDPSCAPGTIQLQSIRLMIPPSPPAQP